MTSSNNIGVPPCMFWPTAVIGISCWWIMFSAQLREETFYFNGLSFSAYCLVLGKSLCTGLWVWKYNTRYKFIEFEIIKEHTNVLFFFSQRVICSWSLRKQGLEPHNFQHQKTFIYLTPRDLSQSGIRLTYNLDLYNCNQSFILF